MGGHGASFAIACFAVTSLAACDPTGVVVSVQGMTEADELWLAVGTDRAGKRYQLAPESGRIAHGGPYRDGFEIYLSRGELQDQGEVALVLDGVFAASSTIAPVRVQRATYVVKPTTSELIEVQLKPTDLGTGQWVCYGRAGNGGFTIHSGPEPVDCDRDGWTASKDPDDADPLVVPAPGTQDGPILKRSRLHDGRCAIKFSDVEYETEIEADKCSGCDPSLITLPQCLDQSKPVRCGFNGASAVVPVTMLGVVPDNPVWGLVRLFPGQITGTFQPSVRAPDEWSAVFERLGPTTPALFLLTDRSGDEPFANLVQVNFGFTNEGCRGR